MENTLLIPDILSISMVLEPLAYPKPGNTHRYMDLPGLKLEHFMTASIIAHKYYMMLYNRGKNGSRHHVVLGDAVYGIMREVHGATKGSNPCLGTATLLSPLAIAGGRLESESENKMLGAEALASTASRIIMETTVYDTIYYYMAIRIASPSYLKPTDNTGDYVNVWDPDYREKIIEKNQTLYKTLQYSSRIDVVADEVINGYRRSLDARKYLEKRYTETSDWNRAVVETYLYLLSKNTDTVIALKHGLEKALEASRRASTVLSNIIDKTDWLPQVEKLDREFREEKINPGSTADLVAATIAFYLVDHGVAVG